MLAFEARGVAFWIAERIRLSLEEALVQIGEVVLDEDRIPSGHRQHLAQALSPMERINPSGDGCRMAQMS